MPGSNRFSKKNRGVIVKVFGRIGSVKDPAARFTASNFYFGVALQVVYKAIGHYFPLRN